MRNRERDREGGKVHRHVNHAAISVFFLFGSSTTALFLGQPPLDVASTYLALNISSIVPSIAPVTSQYNAWFENQTTIFCSGDR